MHTWLSTQSEGWWRLEFDRHKIPYEYISTQTVAQGGRPAGEIRRDHLRAGRARESAGDYQRDADVRKPAALESHRTHAEPGAHR